MSCSRGINDLVSKALGRRPAGHLAGPKLLLIAVFSGLIHVNRVLQFQQKHVQFRTACRSYDPGAQFLDSLAFWHSLAVFDQQSTLTYPE